MKSYENYEIQVRYIFGTRTDEYRVLIDGRQVKVGLTKREASDFVYNNICDEERHYRVMVGIVGYEDNSFDDVPEVIS